MSNYGTSAFWRERQAFHARWVGQLSEMAARGVKYLNMLPLHQVIAEHGEAGREASERLND